jgi:hypothetical protein
VITDIEYDEMTDDYYGVCRECDWKGPGRMSQRDADLDAEHHEQLHEDGVIS